MSSMDIFTFATSVKNSALADKKAKEKCLREKLNKLQERFCLDLEQGQDPLLLFPEEIWQIILLKQTPDELKNLANSCTLFKRILNLPEAQVLFPEVMTHVKKYLLKNQDLYNCRLVCSTWKFGVDKVFRKKYSTFLCSTDIVEKIAGTENVLELPSIIIRSFFPLNGQFPASRDDIGLFLEKAVRLVIDDCDAVHDKPSHVERYLKTCGTNFEKVHLKISSWESCFDVFVYCQHILTYCPNVKTLFIDTTGGDNIQGQHDTTELTKFIRQKKHKDDLEVHQNLENLSCYSEDPNKKQVQYRLVQKYGPQLKHLEVNTWNGYLYKSLDWDNLLSLDVQQENSETIFKWLEKMKMPKLTILAIGVNDNSANLYQFFLMLKNFEKLTTLKLKFQNGFTGWSDDGICSLSPGFVGAAASKITILEVQYSVEQTQAIQLNFLLCFPHLREITLPDYKDFYSWIITICPPGCINKYANDLLEFPVSLMELPYDPNLVRNSIIWTWFPLLATVNVGQCRRKFRRANYEFELHIRLLKLKDNFEITCKSANVLAARTREDLKREMQQKREQILQNRFSNNTGENVEWEKVLAEVLKYAKMSPTEISNSRAVCKTWMNSTDAFLDEAWPNQPVCKVEFPSRSQTRRNLAQDTLTHHMICNVTPPQMKWKLGCKLDLTITDIRYLQESLPPVLNIVNEYRIQYITVKSCTHMEFFPEVLYTAILQILQNFGNLKGLSLQNLNTGHMCRLHSNTFAVFRQLVETSHPPRLENINALSFHGPDMATEQHFKFRLATIRQRGFAKGSYNTTFGMIQDALVKAYESQVKRLQLDLSQNTYKARVYNFDTLGDLEVTTTNLENVLSFCSITAPKLTKLCIELRGEFPNLSETLKFVNKFPILETFELKFTEEFPMRPVTWDATYVDSSVFSSHIKNMEIVITDRAQVSLDILLNFPFVKKLTVTHAFAADQEFKRGCNTGCTVTLRCGYKIEQTHQQRRVVVSPAAANMSGNLYNSNIWTAFKKLDQVIIRYEGNPPRKQVYTREGYEANKQN